jgi:glutaredoxin 3
MVFAKSYCPYCKSAEALLNEVQKFVDFTPQILYLDRMADMDGPSIQMELLEMTGQRTVPNIFINGEHVGGNSDLQELQNEGMLDRLLRK